MAIAFQCINCFLKTAVCFGPELLQHKALADVSAKQQWSEWSDRSLRDVHITVFPRKLSVTDRAGVDRLPLGNFCKKRIKKQQSIYNNYIVGFTWLVFPHWWLVCSHVPREAVLKDIASFPLQRVIPASLLSCHHHLSHVQAASSSALQQSQKAAACPPPGLQSCAWFCDPSERRSHRWQQGLVLQGAAPIRSGCTASFTLPFFNSINPMSTFFFPPKTKLHGMQHAVRSLSLGVDIPPQHWDGSALPQGRSWALQRSAQRCVSERSSGASEQRRLWAHPALETAVRFYAVHL